MSLIVRPNRQKLSIANPGTAYRLVWAKKVSLAAICLVAGSASFVNEKINVSMYRVPVPTYNDIFV